MRRWIVFILTLTTLLASNAWAWDSHGHEMTGAGHAHAHSDQVVTDHAMSDPLPANNNSESDHGCHASAHVLALLSKHSAHHQPVVSARLSAVAARFVSIAIHPLIDPPIT